MMYHIIIPTRKRAHTLKWTLKACLHQDFDNYKIWVSDNVSEDGTKEVVDYWVQNDPNGSKINYRKTPEFLSMTHNYQFILEEVLKEVKKPDEEYLIFIGDDDALVPNSLKVLDGILSKKPVKSVAWRKPVYYWENIGETSIPGLLQIEDLRPTYKICNAHEEMKKVYSTLALTQEVPETYHGANKASVFIDISNSDGNVFFRGLWPDVYSRIRIAPYIGKSYIFTYQPITMHGLSGSSIGLKVNHPFHDRKEASSILSTENVAHEKLEVLPYAELYNAEAMLRAREFDNSIPDVDMKMLIEVLINYVNTSCQNEEHYKVDLEKVRKIAEKNDLLSYFDGLLNKSNVITYQTDIDKFNTVSSGYDPCKRKYWIDTLKFGFDNVYQASLIVSDHMSCIPLIESSNIYPEVPMSKYLINGLKVFREKVAKKMN